MIARVALLALLFASPAAAATDAALAAALKVKTQALADAVAVGDTATWDKATDPALLSKVAPVVKISNV